MELNLRVLSTAVDFLGARLEALGGPWKFPFAGVAIDRARQYNHDQDLSRIWTECDSAAKEMTVHGAWLDFIIVKAIGHVGSRRLFRFHLQRVRDLDFDAFCELADFFDQVLMRRPVSNQALSSALSQLRVLGSLLADEGPASLIQPLLTIADQGRFQRENVRQTLVSQLPSGDSIADIIELTALSHFIYKPPHPSSSVLLKYFYLGCQYPIQLQSQLQQLCCVIGALTSASSSLQTLSDSKLALRTFLDHICSSELQLSLHSWWPVLFFREHMTLSEVAAFALTVESFSDQRPSSKTWMEIRCSWLNTVMELIMSDVSGRFLIFLSSLAQLNGCLSSPTDILWTNEFDFNMARSCLLQFERNLLNSDMLNRNWSVLHLAFQFSVSRTSSLAELCSALLQLEKNIEAEALPIDWPRRVGLWQFPLEAMSAFVDGSFDIVQLGLLRLAVNLPKRFFTKEFQDSYFLKWRRHVLTCRYFYPLSELIVDLETFLEFEATVEQWSDLRSEWGLYVHSSYTASALAQCLLDLEKNLSPNSHRNARLWRQRLQDLILADEPGRTGVLKRAASVMIKSISQVHWRSEFRRSVDPSNTGQNSFFMQLASCRNVERIATLVALTAEMLLLPDNKSFTQDWFQAIQSCHTSFRLSACLIAFDSRLSESQLESEKRFWLTSLIQVRTWNIANIPVRSLRTVLLLLEDHLEPGFMKGTWLQDSLLWRRFCSWQTTEAGIKLAIELLVNHFNSRLIASDLGAMSVPEILLFLDESLHGRAFNADWDRVQGLCRVKLRQNVPSPITVAVCLEHLIQNIVINGKCAGRVRGDIPHNIVQMREALLALQRSIDFLATDPVWSEHCGRWLKAVKSAEHPADLAMPIMSLAAFIEALPESCPYRASICFTLTKEIWDHMLLDAIRGYFPEFVSLKETQVQLTESDFEFSHNRRIDLSYDRLLPGGLYRALDTEHADIKSAVSFADLGMGTGLALLQVFSDTSSTVQKCIGIEASNSRYKKAVDIAKKNFDCDILMETSDELIASTKGDRMLILRNGDLFECEDGIACDVVLLFVSLTPAMSRRMCMFVSRMRPGSRLITVYNILSLFDRLSLGEPPFRQIPINRLESDKFLLQSCPSSGQHLYIFLKI